MRSLLREKKGKIVLAIAGFLFLLIVWGGAGGIRTQAAVDVKVAAANKADGIHYAWNNVAGAAYYYVHIAAPATGDNYYYKVTTNSYIYASAVNGATYKCIVTAYNAKKAEVGTSAAVTKIKYLLPTTVTAIGENSKGTLSLSWKQNKKADSFQIYRSTDGGTSYSAYKTIPNSNTALTVLSFADAAVAVGKQYRYRVYAFNGEYHSSAATSKNVVFNHTSDNGTVELKPTCTTGGITVFRCKNCKTELKTTYPDKLGHTFGNWAQVSSPTCQKKGVEMRTCTRSGCGATDMRETEMTDHKKTATNPEDVTCTKGAVVYYACQYCGKEMGSEYKEAKGHRIVKDAAVPATATRNGKTEGSHCAVCGAVLVAQKVIPMTAKVAVAKLSSVANCETGIRIKWKKTGNADGYLLSRRTGNGTYRKIALLSGSNHTAYTDKKVKGGIFYSYRVTAFKKAGAKTLFAASSKEKGTFFLPAPAFRTAKSTAPDSVTLFWKKTKTCSGYQIRVLASGRELKTGTAKKSASSVTIRRLNQGPYKIYIRSYRKTGGKTYYSAWSTRPVVFSYPGKVKLRT